MLGNWYCATWFMWVCSPASEITSEGRFIGAQVLIVWRNRGTRQAKSSGVARGAWAAEATWWKDITHEQQCSANNPGQHIPDSGFVYAKRRRLTSAYMGKRLRNLFKNKNPAWNFHVESACGCRAYDRVNLWGVTIVYSRSNYTRSHLCICQTILLTSV